MSKINIEQAKERLLSLKQSPLKVKAIKRVKAVSDDAETNSDEPEESGVELVDTINDNLFIFKTDDSYVLSPADDKFSPIIGEFDDIDTNGEVPPCFKDWLDTYSKEINIFEDMEEELLTESDESVSEVVDLGLSVNWATMNLGATKPEEYGNYYAWGELETKDNFDWTTYKYYDGTPESYTSIGEHIAGNKLYDAASVIDENMKIPTTEQWSELLNKCKWEIKEINGIKVYEVIGSNGNSIVLTLGGHSYDGKNYKVGTSGCYWSDTHYEKSTYQAYGYEITTDNKKTKTNYRRRTGMSIRPISKICGTIGGYTFVDLGLSVNWSNMNLGATGPYDNGSFYAWGELETKKTFSWATYKYYVAQVDKSKDLGKTITKNETYDAAFNLSDDLCLPTKKQWEELFTKCKHEITKVNDVSGMKFTGSNGNSIFLPFNGYKLNKTLTSSKTSGIYDSADTYSTNTNKYRYTPAIYDTDKISSTAYSRKMIGVAIRPVSVKENVVKKTIQPLIPFKWGQEEPFNQQLPLDPSTNKRVITGCTQTALAMIVAYYGCIGVNGKKYRRGCTKTKSYVSKKGTKNEITIPELGPITVFDYDNMNFKKKADFKTQQSKNAVAELMKYLGYADSASYTSGGTSASPNNAMLTAKNKLRLGTSPKMIYASNGIEEFKEQIYNELAQGYPVHFSGWNSQGKSGHAFICDGYDAATDKFHFNWGWNGSYDGWFQITILKPTSSTDFSYSKRCIIGLHPDYILGDTNNDSKVDISDILKMVQSIVDKKKYDYKEDINSDEKVDENDVSVLLDYIMGKFKL